MEDWTPWVAAGGIVLASLIAAGYTVWLGLSRMRADDRREFGRWLAEQRLRRYVEAQTLQRELVFTASGTLQSQLGIVRSWSGDDVPNYSYARWLSLNDELRAVVASLRMLGADEVANHLTDTLTAWWEDNVRQVMRDSKPELGGMSVEHYEQWRLSRDGRANWYLDRVDEMIGFAREDIHRLGSNSGLLVAEHHPLPIYPIPPAIKPGE